MKKKQLEKLIHHPAFPNLPSIQERLQFIASNHLSFIEEKIIPAAHLTETEEKQRNPVQMNEEDLQKTLSCIENVELGPQLIIKDFHLKKIKTPLQTEVFQVEMDLVKREFK